MNRIEPAASWIRLWRGVVVPAVLLAAMVVGGPASGERASASPAPSPVVGQDCRTVPGIAAEMLRRHERRATDLADAGPTGAMTTSSLVGSPAFTDVGQIEKGSVIDMGGVIVMVDDGSGIFGTPFNSSGLRMDTVQLSQTYYASRPDDVDTLAFMPNFDHGDGTFEMLVKNQVRGINRPIKDDSGSFGSFGRLESVLLFANFNRKPLDPAQRLATDNNSHLSLVAHEWAHRFGAFVPFDKNGVISTDILGRDLSHWCFFLDTRSLFFSAGMSALEGNRWRENFDGDWVTQGATDGFSPLDLYLMGLFAPEEVPPFFYVDGPRGAFSCASSPISTPPQSAVTVPGSARFVTIDDVVAASGLRSPDPTVSVKDFRMAFVLLALNGRFPSAAEVARLDRLRREWESYFELATGGRATMDTSTGPPAGPAVTFASVRIPDTVQAGHPFRLSLLALDADGRVATGYTGTVRFSSATDPVAILPAEVTFTAADRGYVDVTGTLTFSAGGSMDITVTDVADPAVTGTRLGLPVDAPALSICSPDLPDLTATTTRPWGAGASFVANQGVRFQYLIHRDAIGRPGLITGVDWAIADSPDRVDWEQASITLAHKLDFRLADGPSGTGDAILDNLTDSDDVTQVVTGRISKTGLADTGRLRFRLDTSFPYNGIDHLLVEVRYAGGVPPGVLTDDVIGGANMLTVEKLGPNASVPRQSTSTVCLDIRLPSGVLPTTTGLELQHVGNTVSTFTWRTSPSTSAVVRFGESGGPLDRVTEVQRFDVTHTIGIAGLLPGTQYAAVGESRDLDDQVVTTAPLIFTTTVLRPSISSLTPATLPTGTPNTLVRVRGENLFDGLVAGIVEAAPDANGMAVPDPKVRVVAFNRVSDTVVDMGVVIDTDAVPGPRRVRIVNPDGFEATSSMFFGVEAPLEAIDLDLSGRVDGFDLARLARAFGSGFPDARYDVAADLDGDGDVDGLDLTRLADRFGL